MTLLKPFKEMKFTQHLHLEVTAQLKSPTELFIEYKFTGQVDAIRWPAAAASSERLDHLWEHTCLEAFLGRADDSYQEVNCSPNGHWNAYEFSAYRAGMTPSETLKVQLVQKNSSPAEESFQVLVSSSEKLQISRLGLCAVVEFLDGSQSYWALSHESAEADFHLRKSWVSFSL